MFPFRRRLECAAVVTLAFTGASVACGPDFPESYYAMSEQQLLASPEGFFVAEIARLLPEAAPPFRAIKVPVENVRRQNLEIDVDDLRQALAERGETRVGIVESYGQARQALDEWIDSTCGRDGGRKPEPWPDLPAMQLPAGLPAEFRHYFLGAVAWHRRHYDEARTEWQAVLDLPSNERRHRTVWATFMLGRLEVEGMGLLFSREREAVTAHYREARRRLRDTRELVAEGFPDRLGLAAASWGWEAKAALEMKEFPLAMNLYVSQYAAGDDTALQSLRRTASDAVLHWPRQLDNLASDPVARRVITAWFISNGGPGFSVGWPGSEWSKSWAEALERAKLGAQPEADRMAWLAYEAGYFSLAERWVALAPSDSAEGKWIQAKLALRRGNLREGERLLRAALAIPTWAEVHRARAYADLERVCLARDDFSGALEAALQGRHWEDVAYVAEHVMTVKELMTFVDSPALAIAPPSSDEIGWATPSDPRGALRHLLARRLVRMGKVTEAQNYFAAETQEKFRDYVNNVRSGFDAALPSAERAGAFWRAAQFVHTNGQEILGTELEPDWAIWGGSFATSPSVEMRRSGPENVGGIFSPTQTELERLSQQPSPEKRFHYRYRAADLAWWAAALLPNDAEETAEILNEAGGWLKARDPLAAERFYQALVIRCGNTELGRAAARAHWFPKAKATAGSGEI